MQHDISRRDFGWTVALGLAAGAAAHLGAAPQAGRGDLTRLSAVDLVRLMKTGQVSAREVMAAHLARIEQVNSKVNAIVTLVAERAMADAAKADEARAAGRASGVLGERHHQVRGLARRGTHRRRCRSRAVAAEPVVRGEPGVVRALRLFRAARDAGRAV
jgi:hypothetical protein